MVSRRQLVKFARLLPVEEYRYGLRHRVAAAIEHEETFLPFEPQTVLDVGANRGQFALFALRRFPGARIICFEPLPEPAAVLRRLLVKHPAVEVHEVALASTSCRARMHKTRKDVSSSLLPITRRQEAAFRGSEEVEAIEVAVRRLDDYVDPAC